MIDEMIAVYNKYYMTTHRSVIYDPKDGTGKVTCPVLPPIELIEGNMQGVHMKILKYIFNSEEFGQIRTVTINKEPWFVGKMWRLFSDCKTAECNATHVDENDTLKQGLTDSLGRIQETILINESGLYALIFGSKLDSAKRFKHWVTSEVLPSIRRTGSYEMEQYSPEMKAILMHDKKLVKMDERVTNLENTMTIDYGQQQVLGETVNHVVIDHLGGKNSEGIQRNREESICRVQS